MTADAVTPEVKPEVVFIFDLVREVLEGKMRIPRFQRPFVWRRDQMTDLLDSIRRQYPIGSLLVWETDTRVASAEWVGPLRVPASTWPVTALVLDGQQRLSTLVGTLCKPSEAQPHHPRLDDPDRWRIWFNAKTKDFEHLKAEETQEPWHFPLWSLMDTIAFLNECERIKRSDNTSAAQYIMAVQELVRSFQAYKLPVTRIKNTNLGKAVDIFARLNSKGQSMAADQMVSALSYREEPGGQAQFDLSENIDRLLEQLDARGFSDLDRTVVLRVLLACLGVDIYRADWTQLAEERRSDFSEKLPQAVEDAEKALGLAATFLHELGVRTTRLLPYGMHLIALAAFFFKRPEPTDEQRRFLRRWFWVSSFTARFGASNSSRDSNLVAKFRDELSAMDAPSDLDGVRLDGAADPFPATFDFRSARVRAFLLMLLSHQPRDATGQPIVDPWLRIAEHGPNAVGRILGSVEDKELAGSPANRILRTTDPKDRGQAKKWLLNLRDQPDATRQQVLESHGISEAAYQALERGDGPAFLRLRRDHLIVLERVFMQREGVTLPSDPTPKPSAIDTD